MYTEEEVKAAERESVNIEVGNEKKRISAFRSGKILMWDEMRKQLEEKYTEIEVIENEKVSFRNWIKELKSQLESKDKELKDSLDVIDHLKETCDNYQKDLEAKDKEIDRHLKHIETLREERNIQYGKNNDLAAQLQSLKASQEQPKEEGENDMTDFFEPKENAGYWHRTFSDISQILFKGGKARHVVDYLYNTQALTSHTKQGGGFSEYSDAIKMVDEVLESVANDLKELRESLPPQSPDKRESECGHKGYLRTKGMDGKYYCANCGNETTKK